MISTVSIGEMFYGSAKSETPERSREKQEDFIRRFQLLVFDEPCASVYGTIRADLERQGKPISHPDLQIAATAITHSLILVTHNIREFSRISQLVIEDWEG
jgi:tRNA(fMet)-specific endonuclease VapC